MLPSGKELVAMGTVARNGLSPINSVEDMGVHYQILVHALEAVLARTLTRSGERVVGDHDLRELTDPLSLSRRKRHDDYVECSACHRTLDLWGGNHAEGCWVPALFALYILTPPAPPGIHSAEARP